MSINNTCICDYCGQDLSDNKGVPNFRIVLSDERILNKSHMSECLIMIYPPIGDEKHFCNRRCLKEWLKDK
jgi:hypothetical protein